MKYLCINKIVQICIVKTIQDKGVCSFTEKLMKRCSIQQFQLYQSNYKMKIEYIKAQNKISSIMYVLIDNN